MNPVVRSILGVVAGIVASFIIVACVEAVNLVVFPLPKGINMFDREALKAAMAAMPVTAKVVVLAGWALGAFVGTFLAAKISKNAALGIVVGALLLTAAVLNMLSMPHPAWFWAAAIVIYLVTTALGSRLGAGSQTPATPAAA